MFHCRIFCIEVYAFDRILQPLKTLAKKLTVQAEILHFTSIRKQQLKRYWSANKIFLEYYLPAQVVRYEEIEILSWSAAFHQFAVSF